MTIENALAEFLLDQQIRGNSPRTVEFYQSCIGLFASYAEETHVAEITLSKLKGYYMHLHARKLASVTIQTYVRALRAFLSWCYQQEYIPVNLSEKFRLPKAQRKTIDILTDCEVHTLLSCFHLRYAVHLRNYCMCSLMLDSGLRMHEVSTLEIHSIHLAEGYAIVNGKGNKQRLVPLGIHTRKFLMKYISRRPASTPSDILFLKVNGDPIVDGTIKQLFRKLKKQTGIPRLKAHLLRHTFATRYLENGGDIYSLQQILGHTSLEMVKRYIHTTTRKTVSKFSNYSPLDNLA